MAVLPSPLPLLADLLAAHAARRPDALALHFEGSRLRYGELAARSVRVAAQLQRGALGAHMNLFHRDYDLLITPTLSVAAFDAGRDVEASNANHALPQRSGYLPPLPPSPFFRVR